MGRAASDTITTAAADSTHTLEDTIDKVEDPLATDFCDLADVVDAINRIIDTPRHPEPIEEEMEEINEFYNNDAISEDFIKDAVTESSFSTDTLNPNEAIVEPETNARIREVLVIETPVVTPPLCPPPVPARTLKPAVVPEQKPTTSDVFETPQLIQCEVDLVNPEEICIRKVETYIAERWSDTTSQISLPTNMDDVIQCEPTSEMYYTASSEVSLLSDLEGPEKNMEDSISNEMGKEEKKECVIAGHVAAMRERFENMTRANTPCPDLIRSLSPSLDAIVNITPSPEFLGG